MTPETKYDYRNAVPHYMRTRRLTPRLLALSILFASSLVLGWGTQALAKLDRVARKSPLDDFRPGTRTLLLQETGEEGRCLGILSVELTPKTTAEGTSTLEIGSQFRVSDGENSVLVDSRLGLAFDYLGELVDLHARLKLADRATLELRGGAAEEPLLATVKTASGGSKTLSLFPLGRIFLYETVEDRFRLRLPNSLRGMEEIAELQDTKGIEIKESTPQDAEPCRKSLAEINGQALLSVPLGQKLFEGDRGITDVLEQLHY